MTGDSPHAREVLRTELRRLLLELARREDDRAADRAAEQPYWAACPPTVQGHRTAAAALRDEADHLISLAGTQVELREVGGR